MRKDALLTERNRVMAALRQVGLQQDADVDLADAALLLAAADRPDKDLEPYRQHLHDIAQAAAALTDGSASVAIQRDALRSVVVEQFGYRGDRASYDDPRNANLMHVIDRRRGLPVALGILYIHAARHYGGNIVGLNFPTHFLLRIAGRGQRTIIDPFDGARAVGARDLRQRLKDALGADAEIAPDHYSDVGVRDILIRLQNNIKIRAIAGGDLDRALAVLDTMVAIAPLRADFRWETALLHIQLGNIRTAIQTLETLLDESSASETQEQVKRLLRRLRSRLN